jgi:hypothetical protein
LTQHDVGTIAAHFARVEVRKYFGAVAGRVLPDKYPLINKLDWLLLIALGPAASVLGSRVLVGGRLSR